MELILITVLMMVFLGINIAQYLIGLAATPPGTVYLGTVHYAIDYLYYLATITHGKDSWFLNHFLLTSEPMQPILVGWIYVFLGKIFSLVGITPIIGYQVANVLCGFLYLFCAYMLIRMIFPKSPQARIASFLLFLFSNAWIRLEYVNGVATIETFHTWFNWGEPFVRFGTVPHHLLIQASVMASLILFCAWVAHVPRRPLFTALLTLTSVILATNQPLQWMLVTITIGLTTLALLWHITRKKKHTIHDLFTISIPGIFYAAAGLPLVIYLKELVKMSPFKEVGAWEAAQSFPLNLHGFMLTNGPVFALGILALPIFFRIKRLPARMLLLYSLIALVAYFSQISQVLHVLNVRLLSVVLTLFYAVSAVSGLLWITERFKRLGLGIATIILALVLGLILLPFEKQFKAKLVPDVGNAYSYMHIAAIDVFNKARALSTVDDTFIVFWPFDPVFPAIAGRRVYLGNPFGTIDYEGKSKIAYKFIDNRMTPEEMLEFLHSNGIDFVVTYPNAFTQPTPFLKSEYDNGFLVIHRVIM